MQLITKYTLEGYRELRGDYRFQVLLVYDPYSSGQNFWFRRRAEEYSAKGFDVVIMTIPEHRQMIQARKQRREAG